MQKHRIQYVAIRPWDVYILYRLLSLMRQVFTALTIQKDRFAKGEVGNTKSPPWINLHDGLSVCRYKPGRVSERQTLVRSSI